MNNLLYQQPLKKENKNAAKAEMLNMDKEERNLQGPFNIIE